MVKNRPLAYPATTNEKESIMSNPFSKLVAYVEKLLGIVVTDVKTVLEPGLSFIEANGGAAILKLAEAVLAEFEDDASWATIIAAFIPAAESAGVTLAEGAAGAILNAAKLNALAGAPTPVVVAPDTAPVADTDIVNGTPLVAGSIVTADPSDLSAHPAVVAANAAGIVGSPAAIIAAADLAAKA